MLVALTGCGGAAGTLAQLPDCGRPPSPAAENPPAGAVLPPSARMTAVRPGTPVTQLNAYVELSPRAVVEWVEQDATLEVVESSSSDLHVELLVTDGEHDTWVQARAICDGASALAEVVTSSESDAQLPPVGGDDGADQP